MKQEWVQPDEVVYPFFERRDLRRIGVHEIDLCDITSVRMVFLFRKQQQGNSKEHIL